MNTNQLKKFAKEARIKLITQIGVKLDFVLTQDTAELRGKSSELAQLRSRLNELGREQLIETVAYTWFNRLMALRFMDANGYNTPKVVTPLPGMSNPEILQNALAGNVEEDLKLDRQRVNDLIDGRTSSSDAQTEAFKLLLVASCNKWHTAMPFMFERISDYTELLLPDDLLSDFSIVSDIRNGMSDEDCQQEELIGWLYQFYISDKKDDVFEALKKNIKITEENIPAATQLFTPRWIVRYMVENTLGKLWLSYKPESKLRHHMPYFIEAPEGSSSAPLPEGINSISDITFLDPCQGSGHVLVYAFDILTKIYEEEGYNNSEIPSLILENNLFGIDIDQRAAQLAAFALTMKARSYYPRFLRKPIQPQVIALENINENIIRDAVKLPLAVDGKLIYDHRDLTLFNLTQAVNLGSLIKIDPDELKALQIQKGSIWQDQEQKLKTQAEYLSRKYFCIVTNPPYMGGKGMNEKLKDFVEENYKDAKSDLMTCFMQRCIEMVHDNCSYGMINLPSWLFLSSYEALRKQLLENYHIDSLLHMGRGIFGIDFGSTAFVISKSNTSSNGAYFRLHQRNFQHIYFHHIEQLFLRAKHSHEFQYNFDEYRDNEGVSEIPLNTNESGQQIYHTVNQEIFKKIPGSPIGYWLGDNFISIFEKSKNIESSFEVGSGLSTSDNTRFLRYHWEVSKNSICLVKPTEFTKRWYLFQKGGEFRKWYGNLLHVVNWKNDGEDIKFWVTHNPKDPKTTHWSRRIFNTHLSFREGITWSVISAGNISFRYTQSEAMISNAAGGIFGFKNETDLYLLLCTLNSKLSRIIFSFLNPTINYSAGVIQKSPLILPEIFDFSPKDFIEIAKNDWDAHEYSLNYQENELLKNNEKKLKLSVQKYSTKWIGNFNILKQGEEELNLKFFQIYGLKDEFSSDVPLDEITILQEEIKIDNGEILIDPYSVLLQLLSYSVGCLFGRYSLNKPGLILANQGDSLQDFILQIPSPSFLPDEDNIIPVLDGEYFTDDIVGRFKEFLKAAFGEEYFKDNLSYIEETVNKEIRKYFVKDFYNDHIKRFKKRPIYWMFSSPKGHFKALIYMHRYQPDLCSKMLNDYLQPFISKLEATKQTNILLSLREDVTAREKTLALKEVDRLELMIRDCKDYERTLFTVATQKIIIDLDEGVKVNYLKFKDLLVPIKGLEKEED
jgi:hypothetical protein